MPALPRSSVRPGATATDNALGGGYLTQLGLQPSQAHYDAEGEFERMAGRGEITGSQADYLKGRNLIETGFNPVLAAAGAIPYQLFDEAFDPQSEGNRSLSNALSQGWQNLRGVGSVVGERIQENPWGALSAIFSSQKTPETWVDHRFDEPSASDIEAFGDPRGTLDQAVMTNILGLTDAPAIDPMGLVNVERGGPISRTNVYGYTGNFPTQQAPWAGTSRVGSALSSELESQRNLLDKLFAGGVLSAPGGYRSSVDAGVIPGHEMSSDTYGYQAGLKAALSRQGEEGKPLSGPWGSVIYGGKQLLSNLLPERFGGQPDILKEVKKSEAARALEAYEAGQEMDYTAPNIDFSIIPRAGAETLTTPGSTYDPSLGGMSPVPDIPGISGMEGTLNEALLEGAMARGLAGAEMEGIEPRIPYSFPADDRAPMVDTFAPPEPPYMVPVTSTEAMASEVQRALDRADRIAPPTGPITANDWFARPETQLQALTELAETDPTIAERYTTPGSQDLIDITSQVESFADMPAVPQPKPTKPKGETIEQKKEAAAQKRRDKRAAAKREAADKRAADKAAAKSARMSAAQKRNIAKVAKASRKAEAKREADTKKRAQEQRDKLDSASKKALQDHMAWMATQTKRVAKEEKKRAKRYAGGKGGALMYT